MVSFALFLLCVIVAYWFWLRPWLQTRPALADFYAREASFFEAVRLKFAGLKQRLTTLIVTVAGVFVMLNDQIAPILGQVDTSAITAKVPQWSWPIIVIGVTLLMQWFRTLSDRRNDTDAPQ